MYFGHRVGCAIPRVVQPRPTGSTAVRTAIHAQSPSARRHTGGDARATPTWAGTPALPRGACCAARRRGRPRTQDVRASVMLPRDLKAHSSPARTLSRFSNQDAPTPPSPLVGAGVRGNEGATAHPPAPHSSPACGSRGQAVKEKGYQDAPTPPSPLVGEGGRGDEGQRRAGMQNVAHLSQKLYT